MPDLIIPPLGGGLADRVPDILKQDNQLIECKNLDLDNAVLGVVTPKPGIGQPYSGPVVFKSADGNNIVGYKLRQILRTKPSGEIAPRYHYLLFGSGYVHGVKTDEIDPANTYQYITGTAPNDINEAIEDGNKIYLIRSDGKPQVFRWDAAEGDTNNPVIRDMGLSLDTGNLGVTSTNSAGSIPAGAYAWLFVPTDSGGNLFDTDSISPIFGGDVAANFDKTFANLDEIRNALHGSYSMGPNLYVFRANARLVPFNPPVVDESQPYRLVDVLTWDDLDAADYSWVDDNTPSPSTALETTGGLPPETLIHATLWNNRMFGILKDSPILRFSQEWNYEAWPIYNQIVVGGSDPIRAIVPRGNNLVIFKDAEVYEFYGSSKENYSYQLVSSMHGTNRPRAIQAIDNNRIIFVDLQGRVWLYDGGFTEISLPVDLKGNYFRAAVMGRYYLLWSKNLIGLQGWTPQLADNRPGDDEDLPPNPNDPPSDVHGNWVENIGSGGGEEGDEGETDPDDEYYVDGDGVNWVIGTSAFENCYAYHVLSNKWTEYTNLPMKVVELPSRGGEGSIMFYDGLNLYLMGNDRYATIREPLELRSKYFFSSDFQEKAFSEMEFEVYNKSGRNLNDTKVCEVKLYTDGNMKDERETVDIIYDALRIGQQRIYQRFKRPVLGKSICVKIICDDNARYFELRDMRIHYRLRGSPIRA